MNATADALSDHLGDNEPTRSQATDGRMKLPINAVACIDLDAPTIAAREVTHRGVTRWRFWCRHTGRTRGPCKAHCTKAGEPAYHLTGYNLALVDD